VSEPEQEQRGAVSLWDLLVMVSTSVPMSGSLNTAKAMGGGGGRLAVGVFVGIFLAGVPVCARCAAGRAMDRGWDPRGAKLGLLYFAPVAWMVVGSVAAWFITEALIRLLTR
jgi:hypothetical protein